VLINNKAIKTHAIPIIKKLINSGCTVLVDKKINKFFDNKLKLAKEIDWKTEYLDAKIKFKLRKGKETIIEGNSSSAALEIIGDTKSLIDNFK